MKSAVRRGRAVALVLAFLAVGGGCDFWRSPTELRLERAVPGVYALLVAGEDRARVLVVRFSADVPVGSGGILPVGDADVRLVREGEETILGPGDVEGCVSDLSSHLVQPGEACYTATLPRVVASGDRFELTVRLADGTTIGGAAVVPGASVVSSPSPGDTVRGQPVAVPRPGLRYGLRPLDRRAGGGRSRSAGGRGVGRSDGGGGVFRRGQPRGGASRDRGGVRRLMGHPGIRDAVGRGGELVSTLPGDREPYHPALHEPTRSP